jgi:hypothetical protein
VRSFIDSILALPVALLPKRMWDNWDLPVANVALASSILTLFAGTTLGITGFFGYMARVLRAQEWTAPPMMILVFVSYVIATPRGLFSVYLTFSGLVRAVAWYVDEAHGDPILTGLDSAWRRIRRTERERREAQARLALEKTDEPDRLYEGAWAGLPDATYVVVAARRKPDWSKGTWVITNDGWFTLGEPFDRPMPNGLRTVYPLTLQTTTLDVLRKGVSYQLPPLRKATKRPSPIGD